MAGSKEAASRYWQEKQVSHLTGAQWGDEGKGKGVDEAAQFVDVVVRTNGGANAGHTIENEYGEFKNHLMPCGFANPDVLNVIGAHVVVDPLQLVSELDDIHDRLPFSPQLVISSQAPLVMPWHTMRDGLREKNKGDASIGTTKRGVGESYADLALRDGFLVGHLLDPKFPEHFLKKASDQNRIMRLLDGEKLANELGGIKQSEIEKIIFNAQAQKYMDPEHELEKYLEAADRLGPMIGNTHLRVREAYDDGKIILGEAGQAALLDLTNGSYPYVTSSHPGVSGFLISSGLGAHEVDRVVGTAKAYMTRVGGGPMPTELLDDMGEYLREKGREYGATTKRPRRTGWFDAVATKYGVQTAGITELMLTKSDILDELPVINICVGYEINGQQFSTMPDFSLSGMENVKPIYKSMKGWQKDTTGIRDFSDFPPEAKDYFGQIEELVDTPISVLSVGPQREAIVYRN
jgi:adenylosuccinate synthase